MSNSSEPVPSKDLVSELRRDVQRDYQDERQLKHDSAAEIETLRRENVRWENAHKVVMAERDLWKVRAERINGLVLRLNADEGLSSGALAGLQRLAQAAGGASPEPKPAPSPRVAAGTRTAARPGTKPNDLPEDTLEKDAAIKAEFRRLHPGEGW